MNYSIWRNKLSALWVVILVVLSLFLGVLWLNKSIHIQTNIFALLPNISQRNEVSATQQYMSKNLNRKVFIVLDAQNDQALNVATSQLMQQVTHNSLIESVDNQFDPIQFGKVLFEKRVGLLSQGDQQLLNQKNYEGFIGQSLLEIMNPGMPITNDLLKHDPLLLFSRYMVDRSNDIAASNRNISFEQGFATLHSQEKVSRLIVLNLAVDPYSIDAQEKFTEWSNETQLSLKKINVQSHWTGTIIFSSFGAKSAQDEISTIGLGSSLGVVFLVLFGFRSLRPMLTEFLAVTSGSVVAIAVTHTIFGEIHLITLVFGASLIGVCVDFSFYFMSLQSQYKQFNGFDIIKPILPSLFVGLVTTLVAYVVLLFSPFPGFRQIAVFSIIGLTSAWITSVLLLPRLPALNADHAIEKLKFIGQWRSYIQHNKSIRITMMIVIVATSVTGLFFVKANDDIRNLQSMDEHLKQEDHYVRMAFSQPQAVDYFVVHGSSFETMEEKENQLINELSVLKKQGKIHSFQALGQWLPSESIQAENRKKLEEIPESNLLKYAKEMQLNALDVLRWQKELPTQPLLTLEDLKAHPFYFLQMNSNTRIVLVEGIHDVQAVKTLQRPEITFQQPITELNTLFKSHRETATKLLIYALIGLAIGLGLIYGKASVPQLILPVIMALSSCFAIQACMGVEINIFSIMGAFLVLGIGVDYAIFYRHGHDHTKVVSMALFLCMLSTILGFGLLSFSHTYAIYCFGLTVLLGVIFSFLYATLFTVTDEHHRVLDILKDKVGNK